MSARLAIIAVLIALALGIALALITRSASNAPPTPNNNTSNTTNPAEELADFDAGRVNTMLIQRAGQPPLTITRSTAGAWSLTMDDAAPWPVVPENPINLLRALRTLTGQRPGDTAGATSAADAIPQTAVRLTLTTDDNQSTTFAFDPATLAGRVRAWANDRGPYLIADEILTALTDPGPIGWRIPRAFPGLNEFTAARVAINTEQQPTIELIRRAARWHLQQPVRATANQAATTELLRALASLQVGRFMPATEALRRRAETQPVWNITVDLARDQPASLSIWGPLEPSGTILLAALTTTNDQPPTFLAIPAAGLADIATNPARYLNPSPTDQAPADIAAITITAPNTDQSLRLQRDLDRWTLTHNNAEPRPDTDNHANQLLNLLTRRPARPVLYPEGPESPSANAEQAARLPIPDDFTLHAIIELRSLDDGILEVIRLGHSTTITTEGTPIGHLTALRGQTRWDFTEDQELPRAIRMIMPAAGLPGLE